MSLPGGEPSISFRSPPVVEVVAAVALSGMPPEAGPLLAAFWREQLKKQFPRLEQQPPYFPPTEQFPPSSAQFNLQWNVGLPPVRLWALKPDGQELLQMQPGWFACNWRKVKPHDDYDRWPARRRAFSQWFTAMSSFLEREGAGEPQVTQCEVTYINHIRSGAVWNDHADFERIMNISLGTPTPYPVEQISTQAQFLMEGEGKPYGRVHVRAVPAYDQDGKTPLYVLELTARGSPLSPGLVGALQFMDAGRSAINSLFVAIATEEMQREWGREA